MWSAAPKPFALYKMLVSASHIYICIHCYGTNLLQNNSSECMALGVTIQKGTVIRMAGRFAVRSAYMAETGSRARNRAAVPLRFILHSPLTTPTTKTLFWPPCAQDTCMVFYDGHLTLRAVSFSSVADYLRHGASRLLSHL